MTGERGSGRDDAGQASVMIVGFAIVLLMTVAAVVDASAAYLHRQSLDTLADGAALSGADAGAQGDDVYTGGVGVDPLHLTAARARVGVRTYLTQVGAYGDYPGLRVDSVSVRDDRVVVELSAPLELPLRVPGTSGSTRVGAAGAAVVDPE